MPIKAAARGIANVARFVTYRLPAETPRASARTIEIMGANGWYSMLWAVRKGQKPELLDEGLIPGAHRTEGQAEAYHIQEWARRHGVPAGAQLDARAFPVVIDEQRNVQRVR